MHMLVILLLCRRSWQPCQEWRRSTPVDGLQDLEDQQSVPHPLIGPQPLGQARLQQLFQGGGGRLLLLLFLAAAAGCCLAAAILSDSWHGCAGSWASLRGLVLDPAGQIGSCKGALPNKSARADRR